MEPFEKMESDNMSAGLTFAIHPDGGSLSLGMFHRTVQDIHRLIQDIDYAVTKERVGKRWVIEELRSSVPTITIRPLLDEANITAVILDGLETVTRGSDEPPLYFAEEALEHIQRMKRLFVGRDRIRLLELSQGNGKKAVIREDIGQKVGRILRGGYSNLGSLEGTLEALNLHGNPTFTVWERLGKTPVRCHFPKEREWKEQVKALLERRVLIAGKIRYFTNGVPRSITEISSVEEVVAQPEFPKAAFGSIASDGIRGGSDEFLDKARRGGW